MKWQIHPSPTGALFPSVAQAPWSACPSWKLTPCWRIKNLKSITNVFHLGLELLGFLIKTFHILALFSSQRKAGSFIHTAPHKEKRQRRVCTMWGCFPQAAPVCRALWHKALSKSSWHHFWPLSDLYLWAPSGVQRLSQCIIIQCSSASSGMWTQLPTARSVTSPALYLHLTFMSQAPFKTQRKVLEGIIILSHSITNRACLVWETEHNPHFSPVQSDFCFHHIPSFLDSITAKLPFEMEHDSLILPFLRQSSLYWLANPGIS